MEPQKRAAVFIADTSAKKARPQTGRATVIVLEIRGRI